LFGSYQPGLPNAGVQPSWSVNDIGGRLSFVGARSGFTPGQFPAGVDSGIPVAYAYAAGTFLVDHPAWFQTVVPAGGTYTVTISSDPYDLKDLKDFSVAPNVPITGKISGHYLDPNGKLQGDTTPLVGWVVQLLDANQQVVATTTTDAAGRYLFNKIKPGQYTVQQVLPAGWRQADPFHADLQFGTPSNAGASPERATGVVAGDFNNDGQLDFAIAAPGEFQNSGVSLVFFIYNPSQGSYGNTSYPLPDWVQKIAVGNFGGHHRADLAILTQQGTLKLLLNDGKPGQLSFTEVDLPALPSTVQSIVDMKAGDLNNDGRDDLVISYQSGPSAGVGVAVILNSADSSKRTIKTYPLDDTFGTGIIQSGGLAIRDVNGDGNLDVVINGGPVNAQSAYFSVALGDGQGNLGAWSYIANSSISNNVDFLSQTRGTVALGDIRQNGSLDAVLFTVDNFGDYSIDVAFNQGGGVYQTQHLLDNLLYKSSTIPLAVALEDVNGDLKPDLVLLFPGTGAQGDNGAFVVFLNTGVAPYFDISKPLVFPIPSSGSGPTAQFMTIADLNNNGFNDLVALSLLAPYQFGDSTTIWRFLNTTTQNPPNQAVTLAFGQQLSNDNDFVNAQLPNGNGLGNAPTLQQPPLGSPAPPADDADLYVRALYRKILQREAEATGLALWVGLLNSGVPRSTIVQAMWESPEHRGIQVDQFYATYLRRPADRPGRAAWINALEHGMSEDEVSRGFLTSEEYRQAHSDTTAYLKGLYANVLGRTADAAGMAAWQQAAQGGLSHAALADGFLQSAEQAQRLVDQHYARYLRRFAEPAGKEVWVEALLKHRLSPAQIAKEFLAADEFFARVAAGVL
jgi:hypothetical protein